MDAIFDLGDFKKSTVLVDIVVIVNILALLGTVDATIRIGGKLSHRFMSSLMLMLQ